MLRLLLAALLAFPLLGHAEPKLREVKTFKLFIVGGESFAFTPGKDQPDILPDKSDFGRKGELMFSITGKDTGLMIGNAGSSPLLVVQAPGRVQFFESTGSGNLHMLEVLDQWDAKHEAFFAVYRRGAWANAKQGGVWSTYWGYAKPWDAVAPQ